MPSIDDIADAVVRATTRAGRRSGPRRRSTAPPSAEQPRRRPPQSPSATTRAERTEPISRRRAPASRCWKARVIDAVLTNRLDGCAAAPVNCLVTNPVYSHSGQHVLIPAGARVLGTTRPVQTFGETRLAVSFHRLLMPDGRTYRARPVHGPEPDRRRRPAGPGEPPLPGRRSAPRRRWA